MCANELKSLRIALNTALLSAIADDIDAQVKAFNDARPREFGESGSKLPAVGHDKKLITRLIREDIKRAKQLSVENIDHLPAKLKVSVRNPRWNSIDINVTSSPVRMENPAFRAANELHAVAYRCEPDRYTVEGQRILNVLQRIAAQYNYDRSDYSTDYFDVNFYEHVGVNGLNETVDPELMADMKVMQLENDPMLGRQLESINQGRAWLFGHGVRKLVW